MKLHGRVVLITGASEGIGAACAREFARRGAKLVLLARSEKVLTVAEETGGEAVRGDVTRPEAREEFVARALGRHQRIDVLVNNAGVGMYGPSHSAPMAEMRAMFEINLFAALEMAQLAAPVMKRQRDGMIVNMSSIAGLVPLPWFTMYSAAKYALIAMTDGQRMELAGYNVRTMAVCPGYVRTRFQQNVLSGAPPERLWRNRHFAITAEECARATARGIEKEARTVVTPRVGQVLVAARTLAPRVVDHFLRKIYSSLEIA